MDEISLPCVNKVINYLLSSPAVGRGDQRIGYNDAAIYKSTTALCKLVPSYNIQNTV